MFPPLSVRMNSLGPSRIALYAGVVAYVLCLVLPAYHAYEDWRGWSALLLGFIGITGMHFSGYANPLLWLAWRSLIQQRSQRALLLSFLALLLAATFLLGESIPIGSSGTSQYTPLSGYYVWLFSIALTVMSALLQLREIARIVEPNETGNAA
jgi:hypothetical protein